MEACTSIRTIKYTNSSLPLSCDCRWTYKCTNTISFLHRISLLIIIVLFHTFVYFPCNGDVFFAFDGGHWRYVSVSLFATEVHIFHFEQRYVSFVFNRGTYPYLSLMVEVRIHIFSFQWQCDIVFVQNTANAS